MPHRVANFLRSSTENITTTAATALKSATRRRDGSSSSSTQPSSSRSAAARGRSRGPAGELFPERSYSYASSGSLSDEGTEEGIFARGIMPEVTETMSHASTAGGAVTPHQSHGASSPAAATPTTHKKHRLSLPFGRSSRETHENASASLGWKMESPPIVFYGDAESSTGALLSGQLFLEVKEEWLEVDVFEANLAIHVVQKKPFQGHCTECANQVTELKTWRFLRQPTRMPKGKHTYPFSILLGGHLPASMDTPLLSIVYEFKAEAITSRSPTSAASTSCLPIRFDKVLDVKRSLPEPDSRHTSVRVFPPTNIKASAEYDQLVHPTSKHTMSLRLDGLTTTNHNNHTVEYWKLKKVTWRLEETIKTVAPACERHAPAASSSDDEQATRNSSNSKKGLPRTENRSLGDRPLFEGWKSDAAAGTVDLEFDYGVTAAHRHLLHAPRYACDSKSADGTEVTHQLMVEMVVSKEWAPIGKPHMATQTGTGRILRMHYNISLSEFPGLGVSWDNEAPPLYQDVPPSPPTYPEELEGEAPMSYEELEAAERSSVEE